jgi:hypothetical protein
VHFKALDVQVLHDASQGKHTPLFKKNPSLHIAQVNFIESHLAQLDGQLHLPVVVSSSRLLMHDKHVVSDVHVLHGDTHGKQKPFL